MTPWRWWDWAANRNKLQGILSDLLPIEELSRLSTNMASRGCGRIRLHRRAALPRSPGAKILDTHIYLRPRSWKTESSPSSARSRAAKIGQTLRATRKLDPAFRSRLVSWKTDPRCGRGEIRAEVEKQLASLPKSREFSNQPASTGGSVARCCDLPAGTVRVSGPLRRLQS